MPPSKVGKRLTLLSNYYDPQTGWLIVEEMPAYLILEPFNKMITMLVSLCLVFVVMGIFCLCVVFQNFKTDSDTVQPDESQVRHGDF